MEEAARHTESLSNGRETIVSAPGKVLLAGGYLVLDRKYTGLVVATSSRFFTAVKDASGSRVSITVRAGQFPSEASTWSYDITLGDRVHLTQSTGGKNKFVEITLANVLQCAYERLGRDMQARIEGGVDVVVLADNDFYSQREQVCAHCGNAWC